MRRALHIGGLQKRPKEATVVAAGLAVLVALLFLPAVVGDGVFFQRDIHAYWYPHIETAVRAVAEGALPVWNPYVGFGRPLLADPNFQLLYPLTWLNLLVQPWVYYTVFVLLHCWATGMGLYFFARGHHVSVPAAVLAAASWSASGPLLSAANLFHHFAGASWMPWVLLAFARMLERPTAGRALMLGAAAGGQALAGSADMCLLTALAAAPRVLQLGWESRAQTRTLVAVGRAAAIAGGFGFLIAAAQWIPVLAILDAGSRRGLPLSASQSWSAHPASLLDLVVPRLVADAPVSSALRAALFEGRGPLLASLYLGAAAAPLVLLGLMRRHRLRAWAAGAFVIFVLLALGRHTPIYGLLASVPPYSMLRYPAKYMIPAALWWAMLAGLGLDALREAASTADRRRFGIAAAWALALALAAAGTAFWIRGHPERLAVLLAPGDAAAQLAPAVGKLLRTAATLTAAGLLVAARTAGRPRLWPVAALGALAVADVGIVGFGVNTLAPPEFFRFRPPVAQALLAADREPRLFVASGASLEVGNHLFRSSAGMPNNEVGWALGAQEILQPPIAARWRIFGSYDGDFTGTTPRVEMGAMVTAHRLGDHPGTMALLRTSGVTHVVALGPPPITGLRPVGAFDTVYGEPVRLYEVPDPVPRAYLAYHARLLDERDTPMLLDPAFADSREVILPPGTPRVPPPTSGVPNGSTRLRRPRLDTLEIDVETSDAAWLVVLEAAHPGWTATVDGTPAPLLTANFLFRAVPVPAGRHTVQMRYRAPGLGIGLLLSASAALLGLAALWRSRAPKPLLTSAAPVR